MAKPRTFDVLVVQRHKQCSQAAHMCSSVSAHANKASCLVIHKGTALHWRRYTTKHTLTFLKVSV